MRKPKCRQAGRVRKLQWAKRPINVSSVLRSNSYAEEGVRDHDRGRLRNIDDGGMRKDKRMLKGERRINRQSLTESRVVRS